MKHLALSLETLSPLTIRSDHAHDGAATTKYIPGPALMGSLAAIYRLLHPERTEDFERLFLRNEVLYPNLYPAAFKEGTQHVYSLPRTALSCKRHPGFLHSQDKDNKGHGVRDSLMAWAIFVLPAKDGSIPSLAALHTYRNCTCGETMENYGEYYSRNPTNSEQMTATNIGKSMRLRTHTGIHRESGTVQESILYNRQVIGEGTHFWGLAKFPDDQALLSEFEKFLKDVGDEGLVHIGTGRTRGMGKVKLQAEFLTEEGEKQRFEAFTHRLHDFNTKLHQQANKYKQPVLGDRYFFALTLHSPLILCDDLLRYQGTIDEATLSNLLPCDIPGLERVYYNASIQRVTGWQELWGTPRTNEYAIETGSVFLFACTASPDEALLRALFQLEEQGAGKRRAEGFGRLCVSDQFHQEIEPR